MHRLSRRIPVTGGAVLGGVAALVIAGCGSTTSHTVTQTVTSAVASSSSTEPAAFSSGGGMTISQIFKKAGPGVVDIVVTAPASGGSGSLFGGGGSSGEQQDEGAGVVYNDNGYILTDQHVVAGATSIKVTFQDGYTASAKLVGTDPSTDVGVIKVDAPASELHPLTFADSSTAQVGDDVVAIGSPFSLPETVTSGIVSQTGRSITGAERLDDPGCDPDRRADQPGQLGRPAAQRRRRRARPQRPDRDQQHDRRGRGFKLRHRLRDPRQRGPEGRQHDHLRQAGRARLRRRLAGAVQRGWREDRVAGVIEPSRRSCRTHPPRGPGSSPET